MPFGIHARLFRSARVEEGGRGGRLSARGEALRRTGVPRPRNPRCGRLRPASAVSLLSQSTSGASQGQGRCARRGGKALEVSAESAHTRVHARKWAVGGRDKGKGSPRERAPGPRSSSASPASARALLPRPQEGLTEGPPGEARPEALLRGRAGGRENAGRVEL